MMNTILIDTDYNLLCLHDQWTTSFEISNLDRNLFFSSKSIFLFKLMHVIFTDTQSFGEKIQGNVGMHDSVEFVF